MKDTKKSKKDDLDAEAMRKFMEKMGVEATVTKEEFNIFTDAVGEEFEKLGNAAFTAIQIGGGAPFEIGITLPNTPLKEVLDTVYKFYDRMDKRFSLEKPMGVTKDDQNYFG